MKTKTSIQALPAECTELRKEIRQNGEFLKKEVASTHLSNYLNGIKDPRGRSHNFGYLFGVDKVRSLIDKISDYNNASPSQLIEGIRIYPGRTEPPQTGEIIPMENLMNTLFLMPVLADGTDLYKVQEFTDGDSILGKPRPCPNECLLLSFFGTKLSVY